MYSIWPVESTTTTRMTCMSTWHIVKWVTHDQDIEIDISFEIVHFLSLVSNTIFLPHFLFTCQFIETLRIKKKEKNWFFDMNFFLCKTNLFYTNAKRTHVSNSEPFDLIAWTIAPLSHIRMLIAFGERSHGILQIQQWKKEIEISVDIYLSIYLLLYF